MTHATAPRPKRSRAVVWSLVVVGMTALIGCGGKATKEESIAETTGSGPDVFVILISEDAWANGDGQSDTAGDARFTIAIDGAQQGGTFTARSSHGAGAEQRLTFNGTFGPTRHTVAVTFINDAWGGTPSTDRNLYVDDITYNGFDTHQSGIFYSNGTQTFVVAATQPSADGTTVTTVGPAIIDANLDTWTITDGRQIAKNGMVDPITQSVNMLLYYHGVVYQQAGANGDWWAWDGSTWSYLGANDPRGSSPNVPTPPACDVTIAAGTSIQATIDANAAGTVYCLAAGTWHQEVFSPKNGDWFIGDAGGGTILDGDKACPNGYFFLVDGAQSTDVKLYNVTVQNYGWCGPHPEWNNENWMSQLFPGQGWIVYNSIVRYGGGYGIALRTGASVINSVITYNGHGGVDVSGDNTLVQGCEMSFNNQNHDDITVDASALKGEAKNVKLVNNYVHDNLANGLWADIYSDGWTIQGNTIIDNLGQGIRYEISSNALITHNVLNGNHDAAIACSNAYHCVVTNNNIYVVGGVGGAMDVDAACRNEPISSNGSEFSGNTVTFAEAGFGPPYLAGAYGANGLYDNTGGSWGANRCAAGDASTVTSITSNSFHDNIYYSPSTSDRHWIWGINDTWCTLAEVQGGTCSSPEEQVPAVVEAGSTIQAGNGSVPGCTRIGCTGSGW